MEVNITASTPLVESYTVVLSVTSLLISAVFGAAASMTIFVALCASKSTRKLRYSLFASVLVANLLFACVWVPMEIYQLLKYYNCGTVLADVKFTCHSLYLLLLTVNVFSILLISVKNLTCVIYRDRKIFHQRLLFLLLVGNWVLSFLTAVTYGVVSVCREYGSHGVLLHLMMNTPSFQFKVILLTFHSLIMLFVLAVLLTTKIPTVNTDDIASEESDTQGELSACLPTIQEPVEPHQVESMSRASTPSPRPNRQHAGITQGGNNGESETTPSASKRRSSLQVNLANLLNRRRHTICQIGNTGTNTDPQAKALQYNYVRKFSVDVMALQAQLENPKVHGGNFPFSSEQNLGEQAKKDLNGSVIKDSKISLPSIQEAAETDTLEVANQIPNLTFLSQQFEKRKSSGERHLQDRVRQIRFCVLLVIAYLCCVLPVYITELLHGVISLSAYINGVTCTTALSALQIIIYPYLFLCMDGAINKTTHKLFENIRESWFHRTEATAKNTVVESNTSETNATQV
ncbi:uncharacterized protein LOC135473892 [Liolophura sinensis]|uniref:uncharacterized protein LOC135473892 n=1 Tax=Liolophura sinensis TaxID=3198878 RepID=UPI0031589831